MERDTMNTERIRRPHLTSRASSASRAARIVLPVGLLIAGTATGAEIQSPRLAYVDPGAGSFLLQAILAALAGVIVTVNVYWRKIKSMLGIGGEPDDADGKGSPDSRDG